MKEIFDWLREQMQNNSNASEAEMFYMADEDRGQCCLYSEIDLEEQKSKTWIDAKSLIDEAEAKWEKDCCEWKPRYLHGRTVFQNCFTGYDALNKVDVECFTFCPYCGKPIKISEVE